MIQMLYDYITINPRHIFPMRSYTFLVKASLNNIPFYYAAMFYKNHPFLYAPIPLNLQMKSCMTFIQRNRCIERKITLLNMAVCLY